MVCAVPSQVALFDVLGLSGQGLENLNQWRKKHGKCNGKYTPGQRGQIEQLMVQEQARVHVDLQSKVKPAKHQRRKQLAQQRNDTASKCPISIKKQKLNSPDT